MFFKKEKAPAEYPAVPPSLNHDSFELSRAKNHPVDTAGDTTPYLGLRARLSQVWINRWTVLLILVLVRVMILIASLNDDIGDAKIKALSACTKVEDIGSAMASMPHYLSVGVNEMAATGITKAVHAMAQVMMMILTAVEQLIIFIINMWVGTYVCLTSALIHGTLEVGIGAVNGASAVVNKAITDITGGLTSDIANIQKVINDVFGKLVNGVGGFFQGGPISTPTIDISSRINDLKNIKVDPSEFVKTLVALNTTIPTYDDARKATEDAIAIPFGLVRKVLNDSYSAYSFDRTVFPVAKKEALSFCSDNSIINDFFQGLYTIAANFKIGFIVVLTVLAVLACIVMTFWEIRRWRRQQSLARTLTQHGYDPMDVVYIANRPITARAGIKLASRFSGKRQLLVRWAVAYGTSMPALFVLSLAIAGLFSCLCQFLLLQAVQKEAPKLTNQVGDFAGQVVKTLDNVSVKWATDANGVITHFTDDINNDILGHVRNATSAVNNTLNTFTSEMNKGLDAVFGQTVLANPVRQVVRCLIGLKVEAVEKGLTWVHEHARVSLPLFNNDTFSAGAQKSIQGDSDLTSFLASPSSVTTDEITGAVNHVINFLRNGIVTEALISTGLLLVYVIVVLFGLVRSLIGMATRDDTRGTGGQRFYTGDGRAPPSPRTPQRAASAASSLSGSHPTAAQHRFPKFEVESAAVDDRTAAAARDEKLAMANAALGDSGKRGVKSSGGHWRSSSHGYVEGAGR